MTLDVKIFFFYICAAKGSTSNSYMNFNFFYKQCSSCPSFKQKRGDILPCTHSDTFCRMLICRSHNTQQVTVYSLSSIQQYVLLLPFALDCQMPFEVQLASVGNLVFYRFLPGPLILFLRCAPPSPVTYQL